VLLSQGCLGLAFVKQRSQHHNFHDLWGAIYLKQVMDFKLKA